MVTINQPKFKLGKTVATPGALNALEKAHQPPDSFLKRHVFGDWGNVCKEDAALNDEAVDHEGDPEKQMRVLSSYKTSKGDVLWIITEWDRSVTTILLPSEY